MALQDYPMADLEQQMDGIRNITSPQASVDVSSKDRGIVQEGQLFPVNYHTE